MPRPKPEGPYKNFQLRLSGEEAARLIKLYDQAKSRNPYASETDVNRRLLDLDPDLDGIITEKDRLYFQQAGKEKAKLLGRAPASKPHLREVSPKTKRK